MASTMDTPRSYGKFRRRGAVVRLWAQTHGNRSDEAAHQQMRRIEHEYYNLIRLAAGAGDLPRIERLRVLFEEAARTAPTCTTDACLLDATRREIHADAQQDVARLEVAIENGPAAETRLARALYHEIAAKRELCGILEGRKEQRRV